MTDNPVRVSQAPPQASRPVEPPQMSQRASADVRRARLAAAIENEVTKGGRVESQSDYDAIVRFGKPLNHVLHLVLTILTVGIWGAVWIVLAVRRRTVTLSVDEYGALVRHER